MKFLNGGETDVDIVGVRTFKIADRGDRNPFVFNGDILIEEVLGGGRIEEVILGFFDDIGGIDEEEKIAISLFVKIQNQAGHDQSLAATGCHVEQKMKWVLFVSKVFIVAMNKTGECVYLVGAQLIRWI